jgi:ankyrin repeat protein
MKSIKIGPYIIVFLFTLPVVSMHKIRRVGSLCSARNMQAISNTVRNKRNILMLSQPYFRPFGWLRPMYISSKGNGGYRSDMKAKVIFGTYFSGLVGFIGSMIYLIDHDPEQNRRLLNFMMINSYKEKSLDDVKYFINQGAWINAPVEYFYTMLSLEINKENPNISFIEFLLDKGAHISQGAFIAIMKNYHKNNNKKIAQLLLDHGADINEKNIDGTALHAVMQKFDFDAVDFLIKNNINKAIVDQCNNTALDKVKNLYKNDVSKKQLIKKLEEKMSIKNQIFPK